MTEMEKIQSIIKEKLNGADLEKTLVWLGSHEKMQTLVTHKNEWLAYKGEERNMKLLDLYINADFPSQYIEEFYELWDFDYPIGTEHLPDEDITLYRAGSIVEKKNKSYGSSWTTSIEIAKKFKALQSSSSIRYKCFGIDVDDGVIYKVTVPREVIAAYSIDRNEDLALLNPDLFYEHSLNGNIKVEVIE